MVIIDNNVYTSSAQIRDEITQVHERFPNMPPIKNVENRGNLKSSLNDLVVPPRNKDRFVHRKVASNVSKSFPKDGVAPSIISSIKPPVEPMNEDPLTRKSSRKMKRKTRRFMQSIDEAKNHFFYPVHAPKRRRSKNGKYRSSLELRATMDFINLDRTIAREICLNQLVESYQVQNRDLIKLNPPLIQSTKAITFDSDNNIIIYTPNSTSKNSTINNAEEILDKELKKLDVYKKSVRLPEYKIPRPFYNRYDTAPLTRYPSLIRTRSLPAKFRDENVETLWNIYLRRVLCGRITWRLTHSSQPNLVKDQYEEFEKRRQANLKTPETTQNSTFKSPRPMFGFELANRLNSAESSVDTGFFIGTELHDSSNFPKKNKSTSSEYLTVSENEHGDLPDQTYELSDYDSNEPYTDDELMRQNSYISGFTQTPTSPLSPRRQAMFDSLEQLMVDVNSVISDLQQ